MEQMQAPSHQMSPICLPIHSHQPQQTLTSAIPMKFSMKTSTDRRDLNRSRQDQNMICLVGWHRDIDYHQ